MLETTIVDAYLERVIEAQAKASARMREIITEAGEAGRDLTAEDRENLKQFDADFDRLSAERRELESMKDKLAVTDAFRESVERAQPEIRETRDQRDIARIARIFASGQNGEIDSHRTVPVGFGWEMRALQSAGGTAIPTTFSDVVTVYERTLNPLMQIATVFPTRSGNPLDFPRLTADVVSSGTVTAEAAGITEGDPTISKVTLNAYKRAFTTLWSAELGQDEVIGLESIIADSIARHVGLAWGTAFTTGNDSSEANGFVTAAGGSATANGTTGNQATDTFFAATDLIDAYLALAAPYRNNASWVVSNTALAKMYKFRDANGAFLYQQSLVPGLPSLFLGRPVYENPAMAAVASASKSVAVGDFSKYYIRDVQPVRIQVSDEYKFNTDQLALKYVTRRDGDLVDTAAIRLVISANT